MARGSAQWRGEVESGRHAGEGASLTRGAQRKRREGEGKKMMRRSFLTGSITLCIITVSLLLSITAENPDIAVDQKEEDQVGSSSFKIHSKMFQVALKLRSASKQQENLIADVSKFNHSSNSDHSNLIDSEGNRTREVAHEISNSSKEEGTNDLLEKRDNETSVQTDGTEKAQQQQDTASEQDVLETDVEPVLELRNETSEKPMDTCVIEESGEDAENELDDSYEEGSTAETGTGHSKEGMPPLRQDDTPSSRDNPPSSQDDVQLNLRMTKGAEEPILRLRKPPYDFLLRCLRAEKVYQCVELKNLPAFQVSGLVLFGFTIWFIL
eukprot:768447-Hanusia_phi.AAC.4